MSYDQYGNLSKFRETVAGSETHTTNFTYDEENRLIMLTYKNGQAVTDMHGIEGWFIESA